MSNINWAFDYAGVRLPAPSTGALSLELQPIDKADRNAMGDMILEEVTMKVKLGASWSNLNGEQAHKIFSTLKANRTGTLKYFDIAENSTVTRNVYYGAGAKIGYVRFDDDLSRSRYNAASVNFIEM